MALLVVARGWLQLLRAVPEVVWALLFVVWVGPGPFAGALAIMAHTIGILGRLFGEVYEDCEAEAPRVLEATGCSRWSNWIHGVLPQTAPQLAAFTLFRFEVNVRATAMVGFVGAGGIGDAIHTAISLFHMADLAALLLVMWIVVVLIDIGGDHLRLRMLQV
jgi:phosphonate transport system permease protein